MRTIAVGFVFGTFGYHVVSFFNATYNQRMEPMMYYGIMSIILLMLFIKLDK